MKVLVYEPNLAGHRSHYASLILPAIEEIGCGVVFATREESIQSQGFKTHLQDNLGNVTIQRCKEFSSESIRHEVSRLRHAVTTAQPDHLLVPTAGPLTYPLFFNTLLGRKPWPDHVRSEGLYFGPGIGYRLESVKKRLLLGVRRKAVEPWLPWDRYSHVDPFQLAAIANGSDSNRFQLMPDPAPRPGNIDSEQARRALGIPTSGRYCGCSGEISVAKGIIDLINAFQTIADTQELTNDRLLLAGGFEPRVRKYLEKNCQRLIEDERIICLDRHLTENEMSMVFLSMNLVIAAHQGRPGSSGIVLRAAAAGRPVLARDKFWTKRIVNEFGLGWTCATWDPEIFAKQLALRLMDSVEYRQLPITDRYVRFQSVENFQATWTTLIRQRMGLPQDDRKLTWNWVLNGSN
ncbi:glycosyltransferase [bacterium]|nr:glycosyltransferase [bacterium]